jgi:hypothetical protein
LASGLRELWWRSGWNRSSKTLDGWSRARRRHIWRGIYIPQLNSVGDAASREEQRQRRMGRNVKRQFFCFSSLEKERKKNKVKGAKAEKSRRNDEEDGKCKKQKDKIYILSSCNRLIYSSVCEMTTTTAA